MEKPTSEKQLQANRINAKKSTGPKTPRGKSISSKNAIKHGFLAQSILLTGESPERFLLLKNCYLNEFHPQTQNEFDLVDTLVVNRWRLLRNWNFESVSLIHEQRQQADTNGVEDPPTQGMLAQRSLDKPPRSQEALSRHEVRLDRQYYRALDRLRRMTAERQAKAVRRETAHENEKMPIQSHYEAQNQQLSLMEYPIQNPKESQKHPQNDPSSPNQNPLAA